ncbi:ABC transporter substrate-binding protein [Acidisphaera sp. L21]|uniref:ABC transporter substrate-binding protein n=1 Tax=Acidisphaera sp. L21 TaxID=1641851 RepID=UPI00131E3EDD|nr:ABC transporter substrate-binding protein [Acidisphaera sp. L21]
MLTMRRRLLQTALAASAVPLVGARAQGAKPTIKIGVLTDLSGPYRDSAGPTSVACTQQAVQEAMAAAPGLNVEVVQGDHLNKPDVALTIGRRWFDQEGVDVITNCNNSAIALAIGGLARERNKVHLNTGAATVDLTGPNCSPNLVHWTYDTWEIAHSTGVATVKSGGGKWFLVAADYAFGHAMQSDLTRWVKSAGGDVLGTVFYPFPGTADFSSYMVQAQASGANIVGFLNAGADFINCVKQAHEFGLLPPAVRLAGTAVFLTDIHSLGLTTAQGLTYTECFYWDRDDRTRAFTERVKKRSPNNYPNQIHAGDYAATLHYLKVVNQIGVTKAKTSGVEAVQAMKAMPTDDDAYGPGTVRVDGRHIHPAFLMQVKTPAESRGEWDLLKIIQTTPTDEAFRPLNEGKCPLVQT